MSSDPLVMKLIEENKALVSRLDESEKEQKHQRECASAWFARFQELCEAIGVPGASGLEHEHAIETIRRIRGRESSLDVRVQELESRLDAINKLIETPIAYRELIDQIDRIVSGETAVERRDPIEIPADIPSQWSDNERCVFRASLGVGRRCILARAHDEDHSF